MGIDLRLQTKYEGFLSFSALYEIEPEDPHPRIGAYESDFDDVGDVALESHIPLSGESMLLDPATSDWSAHTQGMTVQGTSSRVHLTQNNTTIGYRVPLIGAIPDVDIVMQVQTNHATTGECGVYFRAPSLQDRTGVYFGIKNGDKLQLVTYDPSTTVKTLLYSHTPDLALATWHWIRCQAIEDSFTVWLTDIEDSDTPVFTGNNSDFLAVGYYHFRISPYNSQYVDYLKITELF